MKNLAVSAVAVEGEPLSARQPVQPSAQRSTGLVAVTAESFDEARRTLVLHLGEGPVEASLDPSVEAAVVSTALRRRERLLAQEELTGWVVVGALRTSATPGVDEGDEFFIKARRVAIVVAHEFNVVTGTASFAMRAIGHIETMAHDITTKAASVHKLVGRMIRLN